MRKFESLGKCLGKEEMKRVLGGVALPPSCSITCDKGKFACCSASLCACLDDGNKSATCTKGGPGSSSCKI